MFKGYIGRPVMLTIEPRIITYFVHAVQSYSKHTTFWVFVLEFACNHVPLKDPCLDHCCVQFRHICLGWSIICVGAVLLTCCLEHLQNAVRHTKYGI